MSGFYDLGPDYLHGFSDDNCYYNNPLWYLPGLADTVPRPAPAARAHHRRERAGRVRGARTRHDGSSEILSQKAIPHVLDLWGHDVNHDWPWWRKMLPHYVENLY